MIPTNLLVLFCLQRFICLLYLCFSRFLSPFGSFWLLNIFVILKSLNASLEGPFPAKVKLAACCVTCFKNVNAALLYGDPFHFNKCDVPSDLKIKVNILDTDFDRKKQGGVLKVSCWIVEDPKHIHWDHPCAVIALRGRDLNLSVVRIRFIVGQQQSQRRTVVEEYEIRMRNMKEKTVVLVRIQSAITQRHRWYIPQIDAFPNT